MLGYTTRAITAHLNRHGSVNTINCRNSCMDYPNLMALPIKLSISYKGSTILAVLIESHLTTLTSMVYALYHVSVIHYTLKYAPNEN